MTDSRDPAASDHGADTLRDLRYIGPATADVLADAAITVEDIRTKQVSYRQLVEKGINEGVAAKIRREHSLPWTISGMGSDLDQRSRTVNGLSEAERQWVARSNADWQTEQGSVSLEPDRGSTKDDDLGFELISDPPELEPVSAIDGIDETAAAELAEAGITTVRRLATISPERVADATNLSRSDLRTWHQRAADQEA